MLYVNCIWWEHENITHGYKTLLEDEVVITANCRMSKTPKAERETCKYASLPF